MTTRIEVDNKPLTLLVDGGEKSTDVQQLEAQAEVQDGQRLVEANAPVLVVPTQPTHEVGTVVPEHEATVSNPSWIAGVSNPAREVSVLAVPL